jgi:hypothetical protein
MTSLPTEMYAVQLRKFALDILPCPDVPAFMSVIGLIPGSEEGSEIEHAESHKRCAFYAPLQDLLLPYSVMAARVLAAQALALDKSPEPPEVVAIVTQQFGQTIHVGTSVIIANLIDQGYLQFGPKTLPVTQ